MRTVATLEITDYVVVALVLAVPITIGSVYAIRDAKKMTRREYLLGGQQMSMIPVALSLFSTFMSGIGVIGIPSEVYMYGTGVFFFYFGCSVSYIVCYFTFVPLMFPLEITSIYVYLQMRYQSKAVRLLFTVMTCLQTLIFMAIVLLPPALTIQAAVDMPLWMSILVIGTIGTVYTCIGGLKSVIWTDAFQSVIMFIGVVAILIKGSIEVGGFSQAWSISKNDGRLRFANYDLDPRIRLTWLGALLGGFNAWLGTSFNQPSLQRIRSMQYLRSAKRSYLVSAFALLCFNILLVAAGISMYSYFSYIRCDPLKARLVRNPNQIPPYFVFLALSDVPGMAGFYIATLICGTLSTFSSGINALAANTVEDLLERPLKNVPEKTAMTVTKSAVAFYGLLVCLLAYGAAEYLHGPITQMVASVVGPIGTISAGIFILGSVFPWVNKYGALSSGIISFIITSWLVLGSFLNGRRPLRLPPAATDGCERNSTILMPEIVSFNSSIWAHDRLSTTPLPYQPSHHDSHSSPAFSFYDVSYDWFSVVAMSTCLVFGLVVSYATRNRCQRVPPSDSKLFFPMCRRFVSHNAPQAVVTEKMESLMLEEKPFIQ